MRPLYVSLFPFYHSVPPSYPLHSLFNVTDLSHNPVPILAAPRSIKRSNLRMINICFGTKSKVVQKLISQPITSVFNESHIILTTNCPLFAWFPYYNETYNALVRLGFLEDRPFNSVHPSIHGFNVLSYVMKNHFVFNEEIMKTVRERRERMGKGPCVGFHIRMGDRNSDFVEYRSFLFTKDIMSFLKCSIFDQYPKASIYIASDSNFAKGIVLNNTMNHDVFSFTPKATHSDSAFKSTKGNDIVKELFVELLTLGSCDALVGTYRSSFSFLASSFQGKVPYLVTRNSKCFLPSSLHFG